MVIKNGFYDECGDLCASCSNFECKAEGERMVLTKKKVARKYIPPDTQAIKYLISVYDEKKDEKLMTDEELDVYEAEILEKLRALK